MAALRFYVCFMLTFTLVASQSAIYVLKASEATLTPALTKPPDDILWKHNGEKVITFDSAEERVFAPYHDRVLLAWDTAELTITDVRYEDSGEYELDAMVNGRLYRSQYMLKVLDKVSKPVITCEMSDESSNSSTAVRATLSCSSNSMTPEALKFKWDLEGKSHLGPALPITLVDELDDITYSCTANNHLHAETSVFTAKDCYIGKTSQALDILVPIIIASLILLAFCLFPFIFRHQIKRACFMKGKNDDLEKQLQAAAAAAAQTNEERAPFLETDLHRQETIPSQQRLPKQPSVIETPLEKVKEMYKPFKSSEDPETDTAQINGKVGEVASQPVSPSSSVPKTSAGGEPDLDFNDTDPEEYQDAPEEAQSTHTDQVQQDMETTSGGQLCSDQAESEPEESTKTRDQQGDTQSTNKEQDVVVEAKQGREATDLTLTASEQPAPDLAVESGIKADDNEETNPDIVEVDPQNYLSKEETLKEKDPEMSPEHPAHSSDQGSAEPEVTQRPDGDEDSDTDEVVPQDDPKESESAEEEEPGLTKQAGKTDALSPLAPAQTSVSQDQESKPEDREKAEEDQGSAAPEVTQRPDGGQDSDTEEVVPQEDPKESESAEEEEPGLTKQAEKPDALSPLAPAQTSISQDQDSQPEDREKVEEAQTNVGPAPSQPVSPSSSVAKTSADLMAPGGESDLNSEDHLNTDADSNHSDPDECQDSPEEAQSTHTDQVQQDMEPTLSAQSSSPPDQGSAAPEVTQRPDGDEDSDTDEVVPQEDPKESESAEEEEPGLAKQAEKPDALSPLAPAQTSVSQDQESKPEDREKAEEAQTNVGPATSQPVSPSSSVAKTSADLMAPGGEPDLNSEDHLNTDADSNHSDPDECQDSPEEAQSTHTDQVQQDMEPTLSAQSSSPPDQGSAAPEVTQRPDGDEDSDTDEVVPQEDPKESESAEEEEPGLSKKAEKPDALSPQASAQSSSSQDQDLKPEDEEKVDCAEDSNSGRNLQHENQNVTSDHKGTENNDKSELGNEVNSLADKSSVPHFDGSPTPELDKDQSLTSEPSAVTDKSDEEMDTMDPQIQDSPSKESEESKLTSDKVPAAESGVPGSEELEQESTHPPDSSLSPPTDDHEEPKDTEAEPKHEADKAQVVKLDADKR